MQNENTTDDRIIILINPLVIEGETNTYTLNNGSDFKEIKPLEFAINTDKDIKQKLDKKKNKTTKDSNDENAKSKSKLKKKIDGNYDDVSKRKKQSNNKKGKKDSGKELLREKPTEITLSQPISVQELAEKIYVSETDIIRTLFLDGIIVNINQVLDLETAIKVGNQLGVTITIVEEEIITQS